MFLRQFACASRSDFYFIISSHVIWCLSYFSQCDVPHVCNKHILMFKSLVKTSLELYLLLPWYFFNVSMVALLHQSLSLMVVFNISSMIHYMLHDVSCCLRLSVNSKVGFNNKWHIFIRCLSCIWMMLERCLSATWVLLEYHLSVTWVLL